MIEFKLAFLVLYYAAGVLGAVLAFINDDSAYQSLSLIEAPAIVHIFGAILVWPLLVLAATAIVASNSYCRRTHAH